MSAEATSPHLAARAALAGDAMAFVAAVAFSMKAILAKMAFRYGVDPTTLLAARMLGAAPFFGLVLWRLGPAPLRRGDLWALLGLGLLGYHAAALLDFLGLQHISAGLERLVLYVHPTLVVLIGALARRERVRRIELVSLAVCYAGLSVAVAADLRFGRPEDVARGVALVVASALCYAIYLVAGDHLGRRLGMRRISAASSIISAFTLGAQTALTRPVGEVLSWPAPVWGLWAALVGVSTLLPVLLLAGAITRVGPGRAATVGMVGPVAAALLGWAILGEPLSALQLVGGLIVLLGLWLARTR